MVDFALLMSLAVLVTGITWGLDRLFWAKAREHRAEEFARAGKPEEAAQARREPVLVEYARAFFPVILIVFLIRSFVVEPFRIPSGSMMPNLYNGDFILVNKFSYGLRLPVLNVKIFDTANPKRGDVVVFRFPHDPSVNFIKRIVGVPGDHVVYRNKHLYINGKPMEQTDRRPYISPYGSEASGELERITENLDGKIHDILAAGGDSDYKEYDVPEGQYFAMGDNRDRSNDSRFWGFVPDRNLVGKAFLIWLSLDMESPDKSLWQRITWNRIGDSIH